MQQLAIKQAGVLIQPYILRVSIFLHQFTFSRKKIKTENGNFSFFPGAISHLKSFKTFYFHKFTFPRKKKEKTVFPIAA